MPELTLGLAPNKVSFYDPKTNFYLTLNKPVQKLQYEDHTQLERICHALFASMPALILYEGEIPQEAIDAWEAKYLKPFHTDMNKMYRTLDGDIKPAALKPNRAFDRPAQVNEKSAKPKKEEPVKTEEPATEESVTVENAAPVASQATEAVKPKAKARSSKAKEAETAAE